MPILHGLNSTVGGNADRALGEGTLSDVKWQQVSPLIVVTSADSFLVEVVTAEPHTP
jgi:hypothetical protein